MLFFCIAGLDRRGDAMRGVVGKDRVFRFRKCGLDRLQLRQDVDAIALVLDHPGFQETIGHYGPIVIDPKGAVPVLYDRKHMIMLGDWTHSKPEKLFSKLKKSPPLSDW